MQVYSSADEKRGRGLLVKACLAIAFIYASACVAEALMHADEVYAEKLALARLDVMHATETLATDVCVRNPNSDTPYSGCLKAQIAVLVVPEKHARHETFSHMLNEHASVWRFVASLPGMEPDGAMRGHAFSAFWWMTHLWVPLLVVLSVLCVVCFIFGVCVPVANYRSQCAKAGKVYERGSHAADLAGRKSAVEEFENQTRGEFAGATRRRGAAWLAGGSAQTLKPPKHYYDPASDDAVEIGA